MMAVEEKTILRLKVSTWTTIIALTQIVYNGLATIGCIYRLTTMTSLTLTVAALILSLFGVTMGIFLLLGVRREKPTFLMAWLGSSATLTVIFIVGIFTNGWKPLEIIYCVIAVIFHATGIVVVFVLKGEIKQGQIGK